jgi:2-polyprenyl-3-methyl-5-hydroxy-6-metoxy-1,4-benzoquinol methylase
MTETGPALTLEERVKRTFVPPRLELKRIVAREKRKGEPGLRLLPFLVDPDRLAMDIGANRGIWADEMARLTEAVWAFEPNPKLYAFLERAAAPAVTCRQIALSYTAG